MKEVRPRKTLNGKFDAYCHVCWNAVYCLWIDSVDPAGKCPFGHTKAIDCPDARAAAENTASIIKTKKAMKL